MINFLIVIGAFIMMEAVAWFTHKYIMHGFLWSLHKDHHQPHVQNTLEKNDAFLLLFATPGVLCLYFGLENFTEVFWVGLGITLYGFTYFIVHDIIIHQRVRIFHRIKNPYLRAIRKAHKVHHKHLKKENGECFGMLWVPFNYFKETMQANKS